MHRVCRRGAARRRSSAVLVVVALSAAALALAVEAPQATATAGPASRFVPVSPTRLLDTRVGLGAGAGLVPAGGTVELQVTGAVVPADASAVVLNVTAAEAAGAGYVTAYPTGQDRPNASNLNLTTPGQVVANLVTVPVGAGGRVSLFTTVGVHLLADVSGWFTNATSATSGRFVAATPTRVLDTRLGVGAPVGRLGAGGSLRVAVRGAAGVPASGVAAVVVNLTAVAASQPGWVQAYPSDRPDRAGQSSSLNVAATGQTVANLAVVPLAADGSFTLTGTATTDLLADVAGWFTDDTAPASNAGLFVPVTPVRLLDTRGGAPVAAGTPVAVSAATAPDIDTSRAGALLLNVTATEAGGGGYVTAWSGAGAPPVASNLNLERPGQTVPNAAVVELGGDGRAALFSSASTHLLADAAGWFTRDPAAPPPTTTPPPPAGPEGAIVSQTPSGTEAGATRSIVHYRSRAFDGTLVDEGMVLWIPQAAGPAGGRPIAVVGHGAIGFGDQCGPTANPFADPMFGIPDLLGAGFIVAYPDLEGVGDPGRPNPYLVGRSMGQSMLDAARAARAAAGAATSGKVVFHGFSGGGQAALWAGELAASYAPDVQAAGVVTVDPPSLVSSFVGETYNSVPLVAFVAYGHSLVYPNLRLSDVFSANAMAKLATLGSRCYDSVNDFGADTFATNPASVPGWREAFVDSDAGQRRSPPVLFLASTTGLNPAMQNTYRDRACALGTAVTMRTYGADHLHIWDSAKAPSLAWATDRVNGVATNGCTSSAG